MKRDRSIGAYVRVSTADQNAASQRLAVERIAGARGEPVGRWFVEKRSGRSLDRPELARVRELARRGELRRLYVYALDRLTRSGIRDTFRLLEELRWAGCRVVSVVDGFELDGVAGDVVIAVLAWAAQFEAKRIGDRVRDARERARSEGRPWGRKRRLSRFEIARAIALLAEGRSTRSVSMALKVPRSTLRGSLARSETRHRITLSMPQKTAKMQHAIPSAKKPSCRRRRAACCAPRRRPGPLARPTSCRPAPDAPKRAGCHRTRSRAGTRGTSTHAHRGGVRARRAPGA